MSKVGGLDAAIWSVEREELVPGRSRWSLLGLAALVMTLTSAFLYRGICWEALVLAAPVMVLVAAAFRFRDVLVTISVVTLLCVSFLVVEGVNVYSYHSLSLTGPPRMILWCGKEMGTQGSMVVAHSTDDFFRLAHGGPVTQVGVTPAGSAIVAAGSNAYWGCPWQLYVAVGDDHWVYYTQDLGG